MQKKKAEGRVLAVFLITLITMVGEIIGGYVFNSVALLADGIHMGSHALAFGISFLAYYLARRWSVGGGFTFGTWKVEVLGAYTSGVLLFFMSFLILEEALLKLLKGGEINYEPALLVAFVGLGVNLLSAYLLHEEEEHDHNLRSAFVHVLADAFTSLLAILSLLSGKYLGLWFLDALAGFLGFFVVLRWSWGIVRETANILLDREAKNPLVEEIIRAVQEDGVSKVYDIHLIRIYNDRYACVLGIETSGGQSLEHYEKILSSFDCIAHATVEVRYCT